MDRIVHGAACVNVSEMNVRKRRGGSSGQYPRAISSCSAESLYNPAPKGANSHAGHPLNGGRFHIRLHLAATLRSMITGDIPT